MLYFHCPEQSAVPNIPYELPMDTLSQLQQHFSGDNYSQDFVQLKHLLANMGVSIPTLYKQYSELTEPGGVRFLAFGVDPEFADCVDGLVLVDMTKLKDNKKARYIA